MTENKTNCLSCQNTNCLIKKHSISKKMEPFIEKKHIVRCGKSKQFVLEGTPVYGLYFIYEGLVKVSQNGVNDRDHIIRISEDGEIVGHRGFGTGNVYHISAVALEDTKLCFFSSEVVNEMLHEEPNLMYDFMIFYAEQLQNSETNSRRFAKMSVQEKVVNTLLFIHRKFGQDNGLLNLSLQRKDIADYAGTTEEQVIKVISKLKKEGLVVSEGRQIGLANLEGLRKIIPADKMILDS